MSSFKENTAVKNDILRNFAGCRFEPKLDSYVPDIPAYIDKIIKNAYRFECWMDGELAGLAAVYCNDFESLVSFVTMVSVMEKYTGKGIAKQLLERAIVHCKALKFCEMKLEVHAENVGAIHVYERFGFRTVKKYDDKLLMILDLT